MPTSTYADLIRLAKSNQDAGQIINLLELEQQLIVFVDCDLPFDRPSTNPDVYKDLGELAIRQGDVVKMGHYWKISITQPYCNEYNFNVMIIGIIYQLLSTSHRFGAVIHWFGKLSAMVKRHPSLKLQYYRILGLWCYKTRNYYPGELAIFPYVDQLSKLYYYAKSEYYQRNFMAAWNCIREAKWWMVRGTNCIYVALFGWLQTKIEYRLGQHVDAINTMLSLVLNFGISDTNGVNYQQWVNRLHKLARFIGINWPENYHEFVSWDVILSYWLLFKRNPQSKKWKHWVRTTN